MAEEATTPANDGANPALANGTHSGVRLLELLDKRIHAVSKKGGPGLTLEDEGLLTAIDNYLKVREALAVRETQPETKVTRKDAVWLWIMIAGILLLGTLIPDTLFEKLRYKE
jgi:hypothetical protein